MSADIVQISFDAIKDRLETNQIYTLFGKVLLSTHPYRTIDDSKNVETIPTNYKEIDDFSVFPSHINSIASAALQNMKISKKSQSLILMGESGTGKTFNENRLVNFFCPPSTTNDIGKRINAIDCILKMFGNSKMYPNDDSSRISKRIKIYFSEETEIIGAEISCKMFDLTKVYKQDDREMSFDIFHILSIEAKNCDKWKHLHLNEHHEYILPCVPVQWFNNESISKLDQSLSLFGLSETQRVKIYEIVAGILHLKNIQFEEYENRCYIAADSVKFLEYSASLLAVDVETLKTNLLERNVSLNVDSNGTLIPNVRIILSKDDVIKTRNNLAMNLHASVVKFLVHTVNQSLLCDYSSPYISIVDVTGSGSISHNCYDKLCLNLLNDKIQYFFDRRMVIDELNENTDISQLNFVNNDDIIDLFENADGGILSILNKELMSPKPDPTNLLNNLMKLSDKSSRIQLCDGHFAFKHTRLMEKYSTYNFLNRVKDIPPSMSALVKCVISGIGNDEIESDEINWGDSNRIIDDLDNTDSHFIACILPNKFKRFDLFQPEYVVNQLQNMNIVAHYIGLSTNLRNMNETVVDVQINQKSSQKNEIEPPCEPKTKRRPYTKQETRPNEESRYDNIGHLPTVDECKSPTRCKMEGCRLKSHIVCIKCKVHLCLKLDKNCFLKFHTETHV